VQPGEYRVRGKLNKMDYLDQVQLDNDAGPFGALGVKAAIQPTTAGVLGRFQDGAPAAVTNTLGKGRALYLAACPALAYIKEANFVPAALREKWPAAQRQVINRTARQAGVPRLVELNHPVVEAGIYDAGAGTALVLANFTHETIRDLTVRVPIAKSPRRVRSCEQGRLSFKVVKSPDLEYPYTVEFKMRLGLNDIVTLE
jgi:hypothetical protein